MIRITGKYDGGNPQNDSAIVQIDDSTFRIVPEIEDDNISYKFRFDVKLENDEATSKKVNIIVDWQDQIYSKYRDMIFVRENQKEWDWIKARINAGKSEFSISAKKGNTTIALTPGYNYSRYLEFIEQLSASKCISTELVCKTYEGRKVYCLISKGYEINAKRILVTARTHPYETAGSYNVEGIVEGILRNPNSSILRKYDIYIIPMMCPDGVHNGLCRLNSVGSPDLSREMDKHDSLSNSYIKLIDTIRPHLFLEFHNWLLRRHDGIFYLPWWPMMRIITKLYGQINPKKRKRWVKGIDRIFFQRQSSGLKKYSRDNYDTRSFTIEYSWYGRTCEDMKEFGWKTLTSILYIV